MNRSFVKTINVSIEYKAPRLASQCAKEIAQKVIVEVDALLDEEYRGSGAVETDPGQGLKYHDASLTRERGNAKKAEDKPPIKPPMAALFAAIRK